MLPPMCTPGRDFTTEPVAMIALSKVRVLPASFPSEISTVFASVKVPRPSISVIPFFFIR